MWNDYYLLAQHMDNYNTRAIVNPIDDCEPTCRVNHICKMSYSSYDRVLGCMEDNPGPPNPTDGPTIPTTTTTKPETEPPLGHGSRLQSVFWVVWLGLAIVLYF